MQPDNPSPQPNEEAPRGLLFILDDPHYQQMKDDEQTFILKMWEAAKAGRLWVPVEYLTDKPTVH